MKLTKHHIECHFGNRSFISNLLNSSIVEIERRKYLSIKKGDMSILDEDELSALEDQDFIVKNEDHDFTRLKNNFFMMYNNAMFRSEKILTSIMLTDFCTLNCNYCLLKGELNKRKMDMETANDTIKFYENIIMYNKNLKTISVQFTGGEPTLEMDLLKYIVENIHPLGNKNKIKIGFVITSNGTVDISKHADFMNKYRIAYRVSFSPEQNDDENRYDYSGKNKNDLILNNIKNLYDNGYDLIIKLVNCSDRDYKDEKLLSRPNPYQDLKDMEKIAKKKIMDDFKRFGIEKNIFMDSSYSALSPNYEGYIPCSLKRQISEGGCQRKIPIKEMRTSYLHRFVGLKKDKISGKEVEKEIDKTEKMISFLKSFECCAFREGNIINITPDGLIRPLIPAYGQDEFTAGRVSDKVEDIVDGFRKIKGEAAWMKDENCCKCEIASACYGGCVQVYHPIDPNKPSKVCSKGSMIFQRRLAFKRRMT